MDPLHHTPLAVRLLQSTVVCHQPYNGHCLGCVQEEVLCATGMGCGLRTRSSCHFVGSVEALPEEEEVGTGCTERAAEGTPSVLGLVVRHLAACKDRRHSEAAREVEEETGSRGWLGGGPDTAGSLQTDHRLVRRIH